MEDPAADRSPLPASWASEDAEATGAGRRRTVVAIVAGVLLVLLVAGAVIAIRTRGLEPTERAWPAELDGRPWGLGDDGVPTDPAEVTAAPGAYLWRDFEGWHLWVVNGEDLGAISGTVTSDDGWSQATLASEASGTVATEGDEVRFDLAGDVAVAGLTLQPGFYAKELRVDLETAEGPLDADRLVVGGEPAAAMPLVIEKAPVEGE